MPAPGSLSFSFPEFRGATRRLILANLAAYFVLLIAMLAFREQAAGLAFSLSFSPGAFLHGAVWQPLTFSFVHTGILNTLFELLSLWFIAGFLESLHNSNWVMALYAVSVLGTAAAALVLYAVSGTPAFRSRSVLFTAASEASSACWPPSACCMAIRNLCFFRFPSASRPATWSSCTP
jgi:membrane associated rhomboid family serine protease